MEKKDILNKYVPYILKTIYESNEGIRYVDIKTILKISDATLSKHLKILRELKWVIVYADAKSKIQILYKLTDKGKTAFVESGLLNFLTKLEALT